MISNVYPILLFIYTGLCAQKSWHYWFTFSFAEIEILSVVYFVIMPVMIGTELRHYFKSRAHRT